MQLGQHPAACKQNGIHRMYYPQCDNYCLSGALKCYECKFKVTVLAQSQLTSINNCQWAIQKVCLELAMAVLYNKVCGIMHGI